MIRFPPLDLSLIFTIIAFALFGFTLGVVHFSALAWNVRLLTRKLRLAPALALPLLRLAVVVCGFVLAASHGAGALLACLAGFLAVRAAALRLAAVPS